jgi:uncharacterized protein
MKTFAGLVMAVSMAATPVYAQDAVLEQAKASGVVGEMYTGYLGIADPGRASSDLRRRVDEVNARRLAVYTELAQREGQSVETIAALTAEKQIGKADSGEAVKTGPDDAWMRK